MPDETKTKKRSRRGSGSTFQKVEGGAWHIQYYRPDSETGKSKCVKEYVRQPTQAAAQRKLTERLSQINRGEQFEAGRRTTVGMLYEALHTATKNNSTEDKQRKVAGLGWRWAHLKPFFAHIPAVNVTTNTVEKYKRQRLDEGAAHATINRELATLRRMFRYGKRSTPPTVHTVPHIEMLKETNVRTGFVEQADFAAMATEAAKDGLWMRALIEVAYTYGWRRGELIKLPVRQLNFIDRTIRLNPGTTKNDEGREVYMTEAVLTLLREMCANKKPADLVFTRENGKPVKDFRGAWRNLCIRAGKGEYRCVKCDAPWTGKRCECGSRNRKYKGLIPHDFRRSAAKALRRAGVPESVIMATGGWKTASMFRRYAIVSSADQREAMQALEAARQQINPLNDPPQQKPEAEATAQEAQTIQ